MLFPTVAHQRVPDRLDARLAAGVAVLGQLHRVAVPRDNRAHDAHPRLPRDVGHDVMQLDVHLHQGLLHVLDVRRRGLQQPLALARIRPQRHYLLLRAEASRAADRTDAVAGATAHR